MIQKHKIPAEKIQVEVDARLRAIAPEYLERRRRDIPAIRTALARQDYATIRQFAHKVSGTAGTYGLDRMGEICGRMEAAAAGSDKAALETLLQQLSRYVAQVEIVNAGT
jgi:HPt (histidine-containing phosphotransfer) domain-containing protein